MKPFLCLLMLVTAARSASALSLSFDEVPARVRSSHPTLQAARLAVEEARGRQRGAGKLANPTISTEFQNESQVSPGSMTLSLDQSFPVTKRLILERKLSQQQVEAAGLEVSNAERTFIANARALCIKVLAVKEQQALRQRQVALAETLSAFASSRAKIGEVSALDAAQIEVDGQRLRLESQRLDIEIERLVGELKPLLGVRPGEALAIAGELPDLKLPTGLVNWQQRADYLLAQKKIEATGTEVDLAEAKRYGDMNASVFTAREWQRADGSREGTGYIGVRLSIPWPLWNRNEGEIAEKAASGRRARLEAEAMAAQIASEIDAAQREMLAQADLVRDTKGKLLPLLIDHTAKLEKAYQSGQTDLITLQRARDQRLQLEASLIDTRRDFQLARIRYEVASGTPH